MRCRTAEGRRAFRFFVGQDGFGATFAKQAVGRHAAFIFTKSRAFALIFDFFRGHYRAAKRAGARGEPYD